MYVANIDAWAIPINRPKTFGSSTNSASLVVDDWDVVALRGVSNEWPPDTTDSLNIEEFDAQIYLFRFWLETI